MADDAFPAESAPKETYRKEDRRDWLRDEAPAAEAAPQDAPAAEAVPEDAPPAEAIADDVPDEDVPVGETPALDTYALLRMCVGMFVEQAWVQLGLHLAPGAKETTTDLRQAKLAIDTVAHMRAALQGNLTPEEERSLDQALASLRMNYVQRV